MYFDNFIIQDRIFWIYLIITLFFIIIGVSSLIASLDPYILPIIILWILTNIALLITIYHVSLNWHPQNSANSCFQGDKLVWIFIHVIFGALLVISTIWSGQFSNVDSSNLRSISGIFILIGGLTLITISNHCKISGFTCFVIPFWSCVSYLLIWWGLTLYTILQYY